MNDFNAFLKASFAEAPEPADDGFSQRIAHAVARREASARLRSVIQGVGWTIAAGAVGYAAYALAGVFGVDVLSAAGDQFGEVRGVLGQAPDAVVFADGAMQAMSASMTYILLSAAALAGGAVAYRAAQE
ncbi:MAG: hypothetical protein JNM59_15055 [Hyphomonadaceae bacterium]|nr:hypothetical protein [Hyphomonadaceae bacterium]